MKQKLAVVNKVNFGDKLLTWGQKNSLDLFHRMAKHVGAYKKFLKTKKLNPQSIKSFNNFAAVPFLSKAEYFRKYPIEEKLWPGHLNKKTLIGTATSGSTGSPTYFLRDTKLDWQYSTLAKYFLEKNEKHPVLLVNCFGMGIWIGGLITYQAFYEASKQGEPLSIITPGINKKEIFNSFKGLAPGYKTIIFSGYPPFIKDILDQAEAEGVNLKKYNCRFVFAAESFTEYFRSYIVKKSRVQDFYHDTMNIYGSAELGAMAFETPTSILIRRLAVRNKNIRKQIFPHHLLPTLCQYNPEFIFFEEVDGELAITADSAMPVCRYKIGDNGGVFTLSELVKVFHEHGINLNEEARKVGIKLSHLPFVYVYERSDFSVTLYGLQIYPQTIKRAIEINNLTKFITGKFTMETAYDNKSDQYLRINIELKPKVKETPKLTNLVQKSIIGLLLKENSEYRELNTMLEKERTKPRIVFWPFNDEKYFKSGIKQKWLNKQ